MLKTGHKQGSYHRVTYFQKYKISRVIKNNIYFKQKYFMDEFLWMTSPSYSFEDKYHKILDLEKLAYGIATSSYS